MIARMRGIRRNQVGAMALLAAGLLAARAAAQLPPPVPRPPPTNCTADEHRQLDFWVGQWDVYRTGSEELVGRTRIERVFNDCGIREDWSPFDMNAGGSLSNYDLATGRWRQTWIDSTGERIDYAGGLESGRMVLVARRAPRFDPRQRLSRVTLWREGGTVRQLGESSLDDGRNWTTSYDYTYRPTRSESR